MSEKEEETKTKEQNKNSTSKTQLKAKGNTVCKASTITFVNVDTDRASKAGNNMLVEPDTN